MTVAKAEQLVVLDADVLRKARLKLGLRLADVASRARVSSASVCRVLSAIPVGLGIAQAVAGALGYEAEAIMIRPGMDGAGCACSALALERFRHLFGDGLRRLWAQVYHRVAREACAQAWHWPEREEVLRQVDLPSLVADALRTQ